MRENVQSSQDRHAVAQEALTKPLFEQPTILRATWQPTVGSGENPVYSGSVQAAWQPEIATVIDAPLFLDSSGVIPLQENPGAIEPITVFTNSFQKRVHAEWVPVREGVTASSIHTILKEKSGAIRSSLAKLSPQELDGDMDSKIKAELVRQIAYTSVATIDILTEYGQDVDRLLIDKMVLMEDIKYPAKMVKELRMNGAPEKPGRMSTRSAMAYLKSHYDYDSKAQAYEFRGLPIPDDEMLASTVDFEQLRNHFEDADQRAIAKWQIEAFGSDLSATATVLPNMLGENVEFLAEFNRLSEHQINNPEADNLARISEEGVDYIIGVLGLMSVWDVDFKPEYDGAVDRMKEKYKGVGKISRRSGMPPVVVFRAVRDDVNRARHGLKQSFLAASLNLIR